MRAVTRSVAPAASAPKDKKEKEREERGREGERERQDGRETLSPYIKACAARRETDNELREEKEELLPLPRLLERLPPRLVFLLLPRPAHCDFSLAKESTPVRGEPSIAAASSSSRTRPSFFLPGTLAAVRASEGLK